MRFVRIKVQDVIDAMMDNDAARVAFILDEFEIAKHTPVIFTNGSKVLLQSVLGIASAKSHQGSLSPALALELIDRAAMAVNIFSFVQTVTIAAHIIVLDTIPETILSTVTKNIFSYDAAAAIVRMDNVQFYSLLTFLSGRQCTELDARFNETIIKRIFKTKIIPDDLLFTYMAVNLEESAADTHNDMVYALFNDVFGIPDSDPDFDEFD